MCCISYKLYVDMYMYGKNQTSSGLSGKLVSVKFERVIYTEQDNVIVSSPKYVLAQCNCVS